MTNAPLTVYTTSWCGYCHRLTTVLKSSGISYDEVDIELDPTAAEFVASKSGLGYLIWNSWELLQVDYMFVGIVVIGVLGLITAAALYALLAGEQAWSLASGRVLSRSVLAGVAFVFSLYTAFFAAVQLVSAAGLGAHLRFIVAVLTPPAVVAFIVATLDSLALALANAPKQPIAPGEPIRPHWTRGSAGLWAYAHHAMTWSIPIVFVLCAVIWLAGLRWRHASRHRHTRGER